MKSFFKKNNFRTLGLLLWCFLAIAFLVGNEVKFWTDSEVWAIGATKYFFAGQREYFFGIKPLFHFLLWLNFQLSSFMELYPVDLARFWVGFAGLMVMVFSDFYLKNKKVGHASRFLFQMTLFSCSLWIYRAGEVRSDILSSLIFIFSLWLLTTVQSPLRKKTIFFGALVVSALMTPKSMLVFLFLSPFFLEEMPIEFIEKTKRPSWDIVGGVILFLCLFYRMILMSLQFFTNEFSGETAGIPFFSLIRMEHIFKLFTRNPQLIFIFVGVILYALFQKRALLKTKLFWSSFLLLIFIFCYPDPLPFFLASLLPWILLGLFISLNPFISGLKRKHQNRILVTWTLIAVVCFSWWSYRIYSHTNAFQRAFATWAERELLNPNILIYDPTGIITYDNAQHWFLGPAMGDSYRHIMKRLIAAKPEMMLYTYKALFLEPRLSPWLKENYFAWGPSLFIKYEASKNFKKQNCDEIMKTLEKSFPRQKQFFYLWKPQGRDKKTFRISSDDPDLCHKIKSETDYYIFPMKPPSAPAENLRQIFRYDPEF